MVKLNLLTGRGGDAAENPLDVKERDFWQYYLKLLNIRNNFALTDREIKVMSYVLTQNYNECQFTQNAGKELRTALRMKAPDLSKVKTQLMLKRYIYFDEDNDRTIPVKSIGDFQRYVKNCIQKKMPIEINFVFPMNIKYER